MINEVQSQNSIEKCVLEIVGLTKEKNNRKFSFIEIVFESTKRILLATGNVF
jgi:hypothetical protein